MSGTGADGAPKETTDVVDVESDAMYHVRLIHSWPPQTSLQLDNSLVSSFYGLQLELRGKVKDRNDSQSPITLFNDGQTVSKTGEIRNPASSPLHFSNNLASSSALRESLDNITGPFELVILGKVPIPAPDDSSIDEDTRAALQQMSSVQVENTLLEINGERFLVDRGVTGADIYRRLWIVASRASLALPFELTLRRHNLAQVSAKIVPFARRKDVQDAQVAQLSRLVAEEAALPIDIRRKKLFLIQQLDFEREHYLVAYLSGPLQELHTRIMDSCQWQIYEFGKTLWYFHAPTVRLCAQHPLRNHPEARELIERVQQQVQQAVRRLQRNIRSHQRRQRLLSIIQSEMRRRDEEKRKEQELQHAVLRIQHRIRTYQRRKRLLALIRAETIWLGEVRRQRQLEDEQRREEQRIEEKRQFDVMKLEQQRLHQELGELKLELQQLKLLKEMKSPVQETQSSVNCEEVSAIETMSREEQQILQQRLEKLELEFQTRKESNSVVERETQTSGSNENDAIERLRIAEQKRAQQTIEALELKLRRQNTKEITESVTQTSGRSGGNLRDKAVDTGEDLEWQRYLTLLRVSIKNKKKMSSPKSRHTQTESVDGEKTLIASSMFRAPQNAVPFSASRKFNEECKGFPSLQRGSYSGYSSYNSSTGSLLTLKSSQIDEIDVLAPPTRTFESFFAPTLMSPEQPPPPLVEHSWRQDSTFLPLKTSRKLLEVVSGHQRLTGRLQEYREPIRPIRAMGNYSLFTHNSPVSNSPAANPTKLPYITRRHKNVA
ncbi:hypothetical protein JG687_00010166 [Phytophthora cactorum]|uniref:IQ motif, EF-hand binding site n=1 Tax=Phytophthora cactorum TaxID=29920 RepID=A0A8T1UCQ7_9STRA|nr:hypothetical protein JG687_00010166 [Phytophthora cactorum]